MWKFKNVTKNRVAADAAALTEPELCRRAVGRILATITAGILLLLFDLFVGFDQASIPLLHGEDGAYLIRPDERSSAGHIVLTAEIQTNTGPVKKQYDLALSPYEGENTHNTSARSGSGNRETAAGAMSEEELLAYEMRGVIRSLNDDRTIRRVSLPDKLRTGEKITWGEKRKNNTALIALAVILLVVFIYIRRLDPLEKLRRQQMASIRRQLPEFASRLVLLLGAGLVLSAAFERIIEESRQMKTLADDYFYHCMADIYDTVKETNGSLEREFRVFARSSECFCEGSRELMRISNIISDNISKGVELTDKLQSESEALWLSRKRDSEERGRLAETKLTMPLTVFLLVLVVVTVSPALLEL